MSESVIFDDEFSDIDSEVLITLVKDRRVLWDKELEEYKSKTATTSAWRETCIMLNPNFDQLPDSKKNVFRHGTAPLHQIIIRDITVNPQTQTWSHIHQYIFPGHRDQSKLRIHNLNLPGSHLLTRMLLHQQNFLTWVLEIKVTYKGTFVIIWFYYGFK